jgi:ATP-binding cassette, subfamily B, bacterial
MSSKSEFKVADAYQYNHSSPVRWILSHVWRYKVFLIAGLCLYMISLSGFSSAPLFIGRAVDSILNPSVGNDLWKWALAVLIALVTDGISNLLASYCGENIAKRFEADARQELYTALLGKNQAFHDRQRVGDIMARATDDMTQLNSMIVPGISLLTESSLATVIALILIGSVRLELLLVPVLFLIALFFALRRYVHNLSPIATAQREQFGHMNAGLEETIAGIEVVKASAREQFEREKFFGATQLARDLFVKQGNLEARYIPLLLYAIAFGLIFLHALVLYRQGLLDVAQIITVMGLFRILNFPTFISIFTFSLVQSGVSSARRILSVINAETNLDENAQGYAEPMKGDLVFENVGFGHTDRLLKGVSFHIKAGQTVAIVGQTGSGKSMLTQLINRTYDTNEGRVLIDGVDVRDWSLDSLRSQISKIEQDIFLFSRTIADNIAFGDPSASRAQIEQAAKDAQAHDFLLSFSDGYNTKVGERGVTLSGGQRQRIALARAFLSNPRILILDDSTSAIDSATEDEIQRALRRIQKGRTTLLITHRLSQIRWADTILVLDRGLLVAAGTHDELLRRSPHYRRIFARYEVELPPLEVAAPI